MTWHYSNTAAATTLTSGINAITTSIDVGSVSGLPVSFPYTLILDNEQITREVVTVSSAASLTLTVIRGADGTSASSHASGATVVHGIVARDLTEAQAHIAATSNVHGIGGSADVVGTTNGQTLTNKTIDGGANTLTNIATSSLVGHIDADIVDGPYPAPFTVSATTGQKALLTTVSGGTRTVNAVEIDSSVIVGDDYAISTTNAFSADVARAPADADVVARIYAKNDTRPALILDRATANAVNLQEWRANGSAIATMDKDAKLSSRAHIINQIAADTTTKLIDAQNSSAASVFSVNYQGNAIAAGTLAVTGTSTLAAVNATGTMAVTGDFSASGVGNRQFKSKTADETVNNSATLQDDDDLFVALVANATYWIVLNLFYTTGATPKIKFGWTFPTSATLRATLTGYFSSALQCVRAIETDVSVMDSGTGFGLVTAGRVVTSGTAGNLKLQWAQNTANVSNTQVLIGSSLLAERVA